MPVTFSNYRLGPGQRVSNKTVPPPWDWLLRRENELGPRRSKSQIIFAVLVPPFYVAVQAPALIVTKLLETIGKILQNGIFLLLLIRLPRISSKFSRKCEIPVKQGGVFNTSTRFSAVKNVENGKNKFLTTKIEIKKIIH